MRTFTMLFTEEMHRRARVAAAEDGVSFAALVRVAVTVYLDARDAEASR